MAAASTPQTSEKPANAAAKSATEAQIQMGYKPGEKLTPEQQKAVDERKGKVMDGSPQMVEFEKVAKSLSPEDFITVEVAMRHGLTPVIAKGKIMGYDDPINEIDWLPDAVAERFAGEIKTARGAARRDRKGSSKKEPAPLKNP